MRLARFWKRLLCSLYLGMIAPLVPAAAQPVTDEPAIRFGARADVLNISLSPSGSKIAYVAAGPAFTEIVYVIDLKGDLKERPVATNVEQITDVDWCAWATESRLVCQVAGVDYGPLGVLVPFERLFAVNDDGSNLKDLSQR